MTKLIVMLIFVSSGGPAVIPGWNSINACNAAKNSVEAIFKAKHGATPFLQVQAECTEFPNNSQ